MRRISPRKSNTCSSQSSRACAMRRRVASVLNSARSTIARLPASQLRSSASMRRLPSAVVRSGLLRSMVTRSSPCASPESAGSGWRSIAGMLWPCSLPEKLALIRSPATVAPSTASLRASLIVRRRTSSSSGRHASATPSAGPPLEVDARVGFQRRLRRPFDALRRKAKRRLRLEARRHACELERPPRGLLAELALLESELDSLAPSPPPRTFPRAAPWRRAWPAPSFHSARFAVQSAPNRSRS